MAQVGTDIFETVNVGTPFVVPVACTILSAAPVLGTAGSTTTTLTLNKNGTSTGTAPTLTATNTSAAATASSIACAAGDVLTVTAAYGTSAAGGALCLWLQRA